MTTQSLKPADAAEWAALYAAGALAPEEAADLEVWRERGWPEFEQELNGFGRAVEAIGALAVPMPPPPALKEKLLRQIAVAPAPAGADMYIQRDGPEVWRPSPFPGISVRVLHADRSLKRVSLCARMEPGAVYPSHDHSGLEECIVLEGELLVGDVLLKAGDYQRAEPGSRHAPQTSPTGALLLLTLPLAALRTMRA